MAETTYVGEIHGYVCTTNKQIVKLISLFLHIPILPSSLAYAYLFTASRRALASYSSLLSQHRSSSIDLRQPILTAINSVLTPRGRRRPVTFVRHASRNVFGRGCTLTSGELNRCYCGCNREYYIPKQNKKYHRITRVSGRGLVVLVVLVVSHIQRSMSTHPRISPAASRPGWTQA